MLTAHLPSGYILARLIHAGPPLLIPAAMTGAVFPDLDMLAFYFWDHGRIHHHRYWVHIPFFWAALAIFTLPLLYRTRYFYTGIVFLSAIFLHLALDSISGGIMWGAPFNDTLYTIVTVPSAYDHWITSFLLHWTILFEVMIWAVAAYLAYRHFRIGT